MKAREQSKTAKKMIITPNAQEARRRWKKIKGIFSKGPKDPVAWQRNIRKDRKSV